MDALKILVVDDHALVREGLRQVLKGLAEQVVVLEAPHCFRAFELARMHPDLDLVLLDHHLPGMNGLEAMSLFGQNHPELPIVMISGSFEPRIVRQVMALGAVGFIPKASLSSELLSILSQILAGQVYLPAELLRANALSDEVDAGTGPFLTARQREVLGFLLDGCSNKEISDTLALSDETVKNHVSAVLRAFGVQSRIQAVLAATELGYSKTASN
ncbi:MAG: response regulator transcription factor [Rhodoferax sp.]